MSNVLTTAQNMALHMVLEVPWQPEPTHLIDADNSVVVKLTISAGARQAKESINTYLATYIYPDNDAFAVLTGYLDRWIDIGTTQVRILDGNVGTMSNTTVSFEEERAEIRRQVAVIVPYYKCHEIMERNASGQVGGMRIVPVDR